MPFNSHGCQESSSVRDWDSPHIPHLGYWAVTGRCQQQGEGVRLSSRVSVVGGGRRGWGRGRKTRRGCRVRWQDSSWPKVTTAAVGKQRSWRTGGVPLAFVNAWVGVREGEREESQRHLEFWRGNGAAVELCPAQSLMRDNRVSWHTSARSRQRTVEREELRNPTQVLKNSFCENEWNLLIILATKFWVRKKNQL